MNAIEIPIRRIVKKPGSPYKVEPDTDVCGDRAQGIWRRFGHSQVSNKVWPLSGFTHGVMLNVEFTSHYQPAGCGRGDYTGHAVGELISALTPKASLLRQARKISFNSCDGDFRDSETWGILTRCTALFLLPHNRALYIP